MSTATTLRSITTGSNLSTTSGLANPSLVLTWITSWLNRRQSNDNAQDQSQSDYLHTRTIKDKYHGAFDQHISEPVPWVQMKGKWLAKAGFTIDTPIKVEVAEGRLVLTAE